MDHVIELNDGDAVYLNCLTEVAASLPLHTGIPAQLHAMLLWLVEQKQLPCLK